MTTATPPIAEMRAPAQWRVVDFLSDVHLQPSEIKTFEAWRAAVASSDADALFILGDLFEVWVGDDALDPLKGDDSALGAFERNCAAVLRDAAERKPIFFMPGNRDFLLGTSALASCGMTLLQDPTALAFAGHRWLLTHGDELCLDDADYQAFRHQVRQPAWQQSALMQPLAIRRQMARQLRQAGERHKLQGQAYTDLDLPAARAWLTAANAETLIHGHTHRPADEDLGDGLRRIVLSDWDAATRPARTEILRLSLTAPPQRLSVVPI